MKVVVRVRIRVRVTLTCRVAGSILLGSEVGAGTSVKSWGMERHLDGNGGGGGGWG